MFFIGSRSPDIRSHSTKANAVTLPPSVSNSLLHWMNVGHVISSLRNSRGVALFEPEVKEFVPEQKL